MDKQVAIELLQEKANVLGRLPKRSDFTSQEVCLIKAKLGPWNRALEEAKLKEVSPLYIAKRDRIQQKKQNKSQK